MADVAAQPRPAAHLRAARLGRPLLERRRAARPSSAVTRRRGRRRARRQPRPRHGRVRPPRGRTCLRRPENVPRHRGRQQRAARVRPDDTSDRSRAPAVRRRGRGQRAAAAGLDAPVRRPAGAGEQRRHPRQARPRRAGRRGGRPADPRGHRPPVVRHSRAQPCPGATLAGGRTTHGSARRPGRTDRRAPRLRPRPGGSRADQHPRRRRSLVRGGGPRSAWRVAGQRALLVAASVRVERSQENLRAIGTALGGASHVTD